MVSFLNSRPLIDGLDVMPAVQLCFAVPSALSAWLEQGQVDAALIPVIDLARHEDRWERISDACIASDGETLTVRVFSRIPAERMTRLHVDTDSHTSVVLADLLWKRYYHRPVDIVPIAPGQRLDSCESVLLIGDKVITTPLPDHVHHIDLGEAWKRWTGLPFVFAVWASAAGVDHRRTAALLEAARNRGLAQMEAIAAEWSPRIGWPVEVARAYLTEHLTYRLTPRAIKGLHTFLEYLRHDGILTPAAEAVT